MPSTSGPTILATKIPMIPETTCWAMFKLLESATFCATDDARPGSAEWIASGDRSAGCEGAVSTEIACESTLYKSKSHCNQRHRKRIAER